MVIRDQRTDLQLRVMIDLMAYSMIMLVLSACVAFLLSVPLLDVFCVLEAVTVSVLLRYLSLEEQRIRRQKEIAAEARSIHNDIMPYRI
jgi:hypothetical protein